VRTAVPDKAIISGNIPADFQEVLPEFQLYIIEKRKKGP
jgi:hypothetical protein